MMEATVELMIPQGQLMQRRAALGHALKLSIRHPEDLSQRSDDMRIFLSSINRRSGLVPVRRIQIQIPPTECNPVLWY